MNSNSMASKTVAVIIVGYNHKKYLVDCLQALQKQTHRPETIIYIDNASQDGSAGFAKKMFPQIIVVQNSYNKGYAAANNEGLRTLFRQGFPYCLILNPDVILEPSAIKELLHTASRFKKEGLGLIQPVLLINDTQTINTAGNAIHYMGFGYCPKVGMPYIPLTKDSFIRSVTGAAMMISQSFYEDVGGFDEQFFSYYEDADLSWRGLLQGYTHYVSARAVGYHDYDFNRYAYKWYYGERNRVIMLLKNYSALTLFRLIPMICFTEIMVVFYCLWTGKVFDKIKALGWILFHIDSIVRSRKVVQKKRTVNDTTIIHMFDSKLESPLFKGFILKWVINPVYTFYCYLSFPGRQPT